MKMNINNMKKRNKATNQDKILAVILKEAELVNI